MDKSGSLNRVFSQNVFNNLLKFNNHEVYNRLLSQFDGEIDFANNSEFIQFIYSYMSKTYRNEYFYKNTILNKLLLGRHSLKTTVALSEIPVENSIADFIMINGKAIVYEIKTELDNLDRLDNQIADYYEAFDHVAVVTHEANFEKLATKYKDTPVGIYVLTKDNTISKNIFKNADTCRSFLNHEAIFKVLRKKEIADIILSYYGSLPVTTPVELYETYKKLILHIDINDLYDMFLVQLKTRKKIDVEFFSQVPYELKFVVYTSNFGIKDYLKLSMFLKNNIKGV